MVYEPLFCGGHTGAKQIVLNHRVVYEPLFCGGVSPFFSVKTLLAALRDKIDSGPGLISPCFSLLFGNLQFGNSNLFRI
jgi:hypothetical protein